VSKVALYKNCEGTCEGTSSTKLMMTGRFERGNAVGNKGRPTVFRTGAPHEASLHYTSYRTDFFENNLFWVCYLSFQGWNATPNRMKIVSRSRGVTRAYASGNCRLVPPSRVRVVPSFTAILHGKVLPETLSCFAYFFEMARCLPIWGILKISRTSSLLHKAPDGSSAHTTLVAAGLGKLPRVKSL